MTASALAVLAGAGGVMTGSVAVAAEAAGKKRGAADEGLPTPEAVAAMNPVDPVKAAALLKEVKFPEDFEVTIFATPPAVNYPVYVAAAPDGTVYVSSDGNGSLDRKERRGRILRVRDRDGDGRADEVRVLVPDVDSPRGLVWDHDRLYLLHPPHISEFIDRDGDGVAEERRVLVKNIAFGFKDRPADHSSNGLELGVDGWLYAAIGDFGFLEAEGTDGRKLQLRGGGVVRVRPDGTGMELMSRGTRNILEVAVSPLLDGFARDNTNDGGGWDVRFHHFTPFGDHGYPRLYKNFADEMLAPLADYGGGSGCGAAWIDEPGIPARWNNAAFTADWGRNWVYRHGLTPKGATFAVDQKEFVGVTRATDLDVDALSRVYVASWKGATFNWAGNDVGYLAQARPKGYRPGPLPDFARATDAALAGLLRSASHRTRFEAQRTLLRRGLSRSAARAVTAVARDASAPVASRVAAIFALSQGQGERAESALAKLADDPAVAAWALRALADQPALAKTVNPKPLVAGLASADARVRREAVAGLGRWHGLTGAPADGATPKPAEIRRDRWDRHVGALLPRLTDADPVVAHTAMQVLRQLGAAGECLAALDRAGASPGAAAERAALWRVLSGIPRADVVEDVARRIEAEADPGVRSGWLTLLCRLHFVEATWKGASWGTRPDTRGPWYEPVAWSGTPRVAGILQRWIARAEPREALFLAGQLERHRIPMDGAVARLLALAAADASIRPLVIGHLARASSVPVAARAMLSEAAGGADTAPALRGQAVESLARVEQDGDSVRAVLAGLARLGDLRDERALVERAAEAVFGSASLEKRRADVEAEAARVSGSASRWADALLVRWAEKEKSRKREAAAGAVLAGLESAWVAGPVARRLQLVEASVLAGRKVLAPQILAAAGDSDAALADAARRAATRLKLDPVADAGRGGLVGDMKAEEVLARVLTTRGDVAAGEQAFTKAGCVACHTVRADDPLKGPYLGNIATIYKRRELAEAILMPNKSLAQGFVANRFIMKDGEDVEGFVVQEATDAITIRNVAAQELKLKPAEIARREKLEKSLMPEGLVAALTLREFASLLEYLESLAAGK